MGGDVVVSSDGSIRYLYRSIESVDRPKPDDILKALGYETPKSAEGEKNASANGEAKVGSIRLSYAPFSLLLSPSFHIWCELYSQMNKCSSSLHFCTICT